MSKQAKNSFPMWQLWSALDSYGWCDLIITFVYDSFINFYDIRSNSKVFNLTSTNFCRIKDDLKILHKASFAYGDWNHILESLNDKSRKWVNRLASVLYLLAGCFLITVASLFTHRTVQIFEQMISYVMGKYLRTFEWTIR